MAITSQSLQAMGGGSYLIEWTSDSASPKFYLYDLSRGVFLGSTTQTQYVVTVEPGESLVLDIRESALAVVPRGHPGRMELFWYASAGTDYYKIDEYVSGDYALRARLFDLGQGAFRWTTRFLEDVTTHQFRVTPVGTNGNEGTAATWSVLMVRYPDAPEVDYAYSGISDTVTLSAS